MNEVNSDSMYCESSQEDYAFDAIINTVGTFPIGSLMVIDDIRFAATVDGYDLSNVSGSKIAGMLPYRCDSKREGSNHFTYWVRRW